MKNGAGTAHELRVRFAEAPLPDGGLEIHSLAGDVVDLIPGDDLMTTARQHQRGQLSDQTTTDDRHRTHENTILPLRTAGPPILRP